MARHSFNLVKKHFPNVTQVKEAAHGVVIKVEAQDTRDSRRKSHEECALAVACKRKFHLDGVLISLSRAYLIKGKTATKFEVGGAVGREITSFDRGAGFAPGTYMLRKPSPAPGGRNHQGNGNGKKRKKALVIHETSDVRAVLGSDKVR